MLDGQFYPGQQPQFDSEVSGIRNPWYKSSLLQIITRQSLTTNLKLCLDAGDSASLPAASTKWLDTAGGGYDFFLGTTAGAEATDPTINGTANARTLNEYLSFDGGDYLTYDTTNEAWMNNLHKDNAKNASAIWIWYPSTASNSLFGNSNQAPASIGVDWVVVATGNLKWAQRNGISTGVSVTSTLALTPGAWNFVAHSIDEAAGTIVIQVNGSQETLAITYVSPSAAAASFTFQIGTRGNASTPMANTSRLASMAMWEGRTLTTAELTALFEASRRRFGI
ncbi:hypothetical protein MesoLj113c_46150 [Mesorhizobium sp. 113-3-9]|uniref:LamG-like jellyroll fold domain-containing protein n=1 Tax=Mesorhizobium sp. 113-3-9 TaxID=2744517 RepID=UPI00192608EC|nr:LamG-like jellyroll fold domain-containing protein [Mesorhizobium sp. 113-3-9]BCG88505.1 hypothetical protein MesoLj113c_46150 [Mesorhizobium sp. 113-3-9]